MTDKKTTGITECIPKQGFIYDEDTPTSIVCKPKLMPLKSVTLEKVYNDETTTYEKKSKISH
jgi:BBSome-interacting protein 1